MQMPKKQNHKLYITTGIVETMQYKKKRENFGTVPFSDFICVRITEQP